MGNETAVDGIMPRWCIAERSLERGRGGRLGSGGREMTDFGIRFSDHPKKEARTDEMEVRKSNSGVGFGPGSRSGRRGSDQVMQLRIKCDRSGALSRLWWTDQAFFLFRSFFFKSGVEARNKKLEVRLLFI